MPAAGLDDSGPRAEIAPHCTSVGQQNRRGHSLGAVDCDVVSGNPALIQREAIKRMVRGFPEQGIAFATELPPVVLHSQAAATTQPSDAAPIAR